MKKTIIWVLLLILIGLAACTPQTTDEPITDTPTTPPATISRDSFGGILIAWGFGKNMNNAERPYVQRINAEGKLLWGAEGIRLNK